MSAQRTLQQVNSMLNLAKYSESDVKKESIVVNFASELVDCKEIKLLEVNKDMLDYIKSGEWLVENLAFSNLSLTVTHFLVCTLKAMIPQVLCSVPTHKHLILKKLKHQTAC